MHLRTAAAGANLFETSRLSGLRASVSKQLVLDGEKSARIRAVASDVSSVFITEGETSRMKSPDSGLDCSSPVHNIRTSCQSISDYLGDPDNPEHFTGNSNYYSKDFESPPPPTSAGQTPELVPPIRLKTSGLLLRDLNRETTAPPSVSNAEKRPSGKGELRHMLTHTDQYFYFESIEDCSFHFAKDNEGNMKIRSKLNRFSNGHRKMSLKLSDPLSSKKIFRKRSWSTRETMFVPVKTIRPFPKVKYKITLDASNTENEAADPPRAVYS